VYGFYNEKCLAVVLVVVDKFSTSVNPKQNFFDEKTDVKPL
jgi:hypothetical protein